MRRAAPAAVLLAVGIVAMLAAHLDAESLKPNGVRSDGAGAREQYAEYLANRRGVAFGVPRDAYQNAVVSMRAMEHRASAMASSAASAAPQWTALGPLPIKNEIPDFGGNPILMASYSPNGLSVVATTGYGQVREFRVPAEAIYIPH